MIVMVLGDTHGNTIAATKAARLAARLGVKTIVQVGDFGLWDHTESGFRYLDTLNEALRKGGVKMYVVGGNHENWDRWDWYTANNPKDYFGFSYLRTNIRLAPKVHYWAWEGKSCLMVGGAVSIDKVYRTPGESWWAGETLKDSEVERAKVYKNIDYLFTHDCSNATPFHGRLKPDLDSMAHRQKIDEVLKATTPKIHVHGHMHTKYDWMNFVGVDKKGEAVYTQTYGLECDAMYSSWGLLDIATGQWEWPRQDIMATT